jgi:circadian clock protein KaiC
LEQLQMVQPMSAPSSSSSETEIERASTGVAGLDEILGGGLPENHLYLIDGEPAGGT